MQPASAAVLLLVLGAVLAPTHAAFATAYTILDLGTLGGTFSSANGYGVLNASGQVVGYSSITGDTYQHAFRTDANGVIISASDLGTFLSDNYSYAQGINASGQVVGWSLTNGISWPHAFRTTPNGSITPASVLGTLGGTESYATAINASGQVVGVSTVTSDYYSSHAFRTDPNGGITPASDLGTLGGQSFAYGINDSGQAVGLSTTATDETHAFRTSANGSITPASDLGTLGGKYSSGIAINNSGQVVGTSTTADAAQHAYRTAPNGSITASSDLGTLGGTSSNAFAINALGQVVGASYITGDVGQHAFFVDVTGTMQDLNDLIPLSSGWVLNGAYGINDLGQIAGDGVSPNGETHAFLLTPTPEPMGLSLFGLGCFGLLARHRPPHTSLRIFRDRHVRTTNPMPPANPTP